MGVIQLTKRTKGFHERGQVLHDPALQVGNILIDQDNYDSSLDRIYDVNGLKNMHIALEETGGVNGFTYKIDRTEKEVDDLSTLVDADFDKDIVTDVSVATGTKAAANDIVDISPESKAIRIRVKRTTAAQNATMKGYVSLN